MKWLQLQILVLALCRVVSVGSAQDWVRTGAPTNNWSAVTCSADGATIVAIADDGIYYSTNSGTTWWLNNTQMVAIAVSADGCKWAAVNNGTYIYLSTNYGSTWTAVNAPTQAFYYDFTLEYIASSADGKTLIVGPSVYTSSDSGMTWKTQPVPGDAIALSVDGEKLFTINAHARNQPAGIYISTNSGFNWFSNTVQISFPGNPFLVTSADGSRLTLFSNGISNSSDMGTTWTAGTDVTATFSFNAASSADANKLVAALSGGGIWVLQSTPAPVLNIAPSDERVRVSWTVPSTQFVLQRSSGLSSGSWTAVASMPSLNCSNLQNEVVCPRASDGELYRLASP